MDTVAEPMLVLDEGPRVQSASRAFFDSFNADRYEAIGKHLMDLVTANGTFPNCADFLRSSSPEPRR